MRLVVTALVLVAMLLVAAGGATAQQLETPGNGGEETCRPGELCETGGRDDRFGQTRETVADPPGRHLRSLVTIGLIAAVVGAYLFYALSGRSPFIRSRAARGDP